MSLPVVLPGSCCPASGAPQLSEPPHRTRPPRLGRCVAGGGRRLSAAAARAAAALPRLAAAAAGRLHAGAVLRSSVPQQLSPHPQLLSLLGRLVGYSVGHRRPHNVEKTDAAAGRRRASTVTVDGRGRLPLETSFVENPSIMQ
ncbi:unnamed protein product [Tetraodon nigroviridis]|uniref:(spotted green pufferfish) hypothetical protein n=1 Tax=Tetraodon nigroviridis TaxID=99883 RepID=Q4T4P4_TETNG|nr:unnamed protein product [Tetraodon nigroviridis]